MVKFRQEEWNLIKSFIMPPRIDKSKINPSALCLKEILNKLGTIDMEFYLEAFHNNINYNLVYGIHWEDIEIYLKNNNLESFIENIVNDGQFLRKLLLFEDNSDYYYRPYGLYSSLLIESNNIKKNINNLSSNIKLIFVNRENYKDNYSSLYNKIFYNLELKPYFEELEFLYLLKRLNFKSNNNTSLKYQKELLSLIK